jgi:predicted RNA-binding Zn ribbon-like protein
MRSRSPREVLYSGPWRFLAGAVCLDFVNTVGGRELRSNSTGAWRIIAESLVDYVSLIRWARSAGLVDAGDARRLHRACAADPDMAKTVVKRAIRLREALFRLAISAIERRSPLAPDTALFNRELLAARRHLRVVADGGRFVERWCPQRPEDLNKTLWPVVLSAAKLLVSEQMRRLKRCPGRRCAWLFLDATKNARRRWCSMTMCGNREKIRRYRRSATIGPGKLS